MDNDMFLTEEEMKSLSLEEMLAYVDLLAILKEKLEK